MQVNASLVSGINNDCGGTTPQLDWADASGATRYTVMLRSSSGTTSQLQSTTSSVALTSPLAESGNPWTFEVWALDAVANSRLGSPTGSFTVDATAPATFDLASPDGTWSSTATTTFSWSPSFDAGCGLRRYRLFVDSTLCKDDILPGETSIALAATACRPLGGAHLWRMMVEDQAGNLTWARQSAGGGGGLSFNLDDTGPSLPSPTSPTAGAVIGSRDPSFSWSASTDNGPGGVRYELYVNGVLRTSTTSTSVASASLLLADGAHTWRVRAIDARSNVTDGPTHTFVVDTAPPGMFALSSPADGACLATPSPTLCWNPASDGSGIARYQLLVDGALARDGIPGSQLCAQPSAALVEGAHRWQVVAVDLAGNVRPATSERGFRADWSAPTAPVLLSPADNAPVATLTPTFSWGASSDPAGVARYLVIVNGAEVAQATPPVQTHMVTSPLLAGYHGWSIRAVDSCGNAVASPTWKVLVRDPSCAPNEACNGRDDDCDGTIDEGFALGAPCDGADGDLCAEGVVVCNAAGSGTTCGDVSPTNVELCNELDDDCDGRIDSTAGQPIYQSCYTGPAGTMGIGLCNAGTQVCAAGAFQDCVGETWPAPESCNGSDDDCDGVIDGLPGCAAVLPDASLGGDAGDGGGGAAGDAGAESGPGGDQGCGCRTGSAVSDGWAGLVLLGLALTLVALRARRERGS